MLWVFLLGWCTPPSGGIFCGGNILYFGTAAWAGGPGRMNIWYSSLEVCFSFSWCPFFRHPPFWRLSCCPLFWRVKSTFLFTVILPPSFFGRLGPVLFLFFLVFFWFCWFLNHPSYAFYDFFSIIWGAGVGFWRVFKSTLERLKWCGQIFKKRATRATRGPRGPC